MSLFGLGLLSILGIADELDTRKKIKKHQAQPSELLISMQERSREWENLKLKDQISCSTIHVNATQNSSNEFVLTWSCNIKENRLAEGFEIYRTIGYYTQKITTVPFNHTKEEYKFVDYYSLTSADPLSYSVKLFCHYNGAIHYSKLVPCMVNLVYPYIPPLEKMKLQAQAINNGGIRLYWNLKAQITSYKIFRKLSNESDYRFVALLSGDSKRYTDKSVIPNTEYMYYVKASRLFNNTSEEIDSESIAIMTTPIEKKEPKEKEIKTQIKTKREESHFPDFDAMDGHQFETFCAKLLKNNGFRDVTVTKGSGDQGIDIIAKQGQIKYGIQCKCYNSVVGNKAVQEVFSGKTFYNLHVGVVLTNNYFTPAAKELAEKNGILLWNRNELLKLIKKSGVYANEINSHD